MANPQQLSSVAALMSKVGPIVALAVRGIDFASPFVSRGFDAACQLWVALQPYHPGVFHNACPCRACR